MRQTRPLLHCDQITSAAWGSGGNVDDPCIGSSSSDRERLRKIEKNLGGVAPTMSTEHHAHHNTSNQCMAKSAHHDLHIATCGTGKATYDTKNPVALEGNSRRGVRRQVRPQVMRTLMQLARARQCGCRKRQGRAAGGAKARAAAPAVLHHAALL